MNGSTRDRLEEVREKVSDARAMLAEVERDPGAFDQPENRKHRIREELKRLQDLEVTYLKEFSNGDGHINGRRAWEVDSLGDDRIKAVLDEVSASSQPFGRLPLGRSIGKHELVRQLGPHAKADIVAPPQSRVGPSAGIAAQLRRPVSVLNLIPSAPMRGKSVPFVVESGDLDTARETAEGTTKPEADAAYDDAQADAQTIAHWLKIQKQSLADLDGLQETISNRLRDGVLRRLEDQVIAGSGSGTNLRGILATSGIQTESFTAGALITDQLVKGIVKVFAAGGVPDGVLVNPADVATALLAKTSGSGEYLGAPLFGGIFGLQLETTTIPTTAIPAGRALVGDFGRGALLYIREGVSVLISDSDGDDFTRNRVTMLGEMRAALAVWQPSLFVDVDLA